MSRLSIARVALLLAMHTAVGTGGSAVAGAKAGTDIFWDPNRLADRPPAVSSAWFAYALGRAAWIDENVLSNRQLARAYKRSFDEEVAGRELLLEMWVASKESDSALQDNYLDALQGVQKAGFLREYVWTFLRSAEWVQPESLHVAEFDVWRKSALEQHTVETWADVVVRAGRKR